MAKGGPPTTIRPQSGRTLLFPIAITANIPGLVFINLLGRINLLGHMYEHTFSKNGFGHMVRGKGRLRMAPSAVQAVCMIELD